MTTTRPKVLLVCGYFDWFSGYQETALAEALQAVADTYVLTSNRVNPLFSDEHLARLGRTRMYCEGTTIERGVRVTRLPTIEVRSMVWSRRAVKAVRAIAPDLVLQIMPGQGLPVAPTLARIKANRAVLYGDNAAMYADLSPWASRLKFILFSVTKGIAYRFVNSRATKIYGSTPDSLTRLRPFVSKVGMDLLPLGFNERTFFHDAELRATWRRSRGLKQNDIVVIAPGKIQRQKRFDMLVRAFADPRLQDAVARLVFVGADGGSESRAIHDSVNALGVQGSVEVLPFLDSASLNACFNGADIGIWPAMPAITIQQAMGTGMFSVLPNSPYVSHLAVDPECSLLFPTDGQLEEKLVDALVAAVAICTDPAHAPRDTIASSNRWLSYDALSASLLNDLGWNPNIVKNF